jgi:hypothetical protein
LKVGWIDVGSISRFPPMRWRAIHSELWVIPGNTQRNAVYVLCRCTRGGSDVGPGRNGMYEVVSIRGARCEGVGSEQWCCTVEPECVHAGPTPMGLNGDGLGY